METRKEKPRLVIYTAKGRDSFSTTDQNRLLEVADVHFIQSAERRAIPVFLKELAEADFLGVTPRSFPGLPAEVLRSLTRLKAVSVPTTGTEWLNLEDFRACNIPLVNVPDFSSQACAEFTWGLLLDAVRDISAAKEQAKSFGGRQSGLLGTELHGKTLGVVGLGNIGRRVAAFGRAFGMSVVTYDSAATSAEYTQAKTLEFLFNESDVVTLHIPLTSETRGSIGSEVLRSLKPGALLLNTSRPDLVVLDAIQNALSEGRLRKYIFDAGYWSYDKVQAAAKIPGITPVPHVSWYTKEALENEMHQWTTALVTMMKPVIHSQI